MGASALAAAAFALTACSDSATVSISPPQPTGAAQAACTALDPQLPDTVDGASSTATDPDSPFTAAWDDIVLVCGGAEPTVSPTAQLLTIQGVDWYPETLPQGGTKFSTVKRVATVTVTVPVNHQPEADALVDISPAVAEFVLPIEDAG